MRGDCRSFENLLSAMRGIRVEPRLLQNTARHISSCYGNLCASEINGNHKIVGTCIVRAVIHQWVHPLSEPWSGRHLRLFRLFQVLLLNFLGTKRPGMFNETCPEEVCNNANGNPGK